MKGLHFWLLIFVFSSSPVAAQTPYYQGKTIRIMVGYPAGSAHDMWGRLVAPQLTKHIPGDHDITYNDFKALTPPDTEPSRQGAENILAQFPDGSRKVEDYVDASLLDALRSEGYFASMRQKYRRQ